ncbi:extracellular solute-binding protein [Paenibacillus sp. WQ 127069]|uniref:Extracellular solute-binding protein n=1 Tax=Paenibacillus baimaensis TaxID=2982185 RepID=A0ABT2UDU0_9BACL|nr:extracellular solute-binding protein [Paenibacillus sp. WQ 127069]MCU6792161.1 extracellular solute-binding protein [Paenibacillus sp. WQ 127069]
MNIRWRALTVLSIVAALAAGCTAQTGQGTQGKDPGAGEKKTFSMLTESTTNWPYSKDWLIWKLLEDKTGVKLNVQLPSGKMEDAINLYVASGNMPDILVVQNKAQADKFGQQGAFVNLLDYLDQMPNFKKWIAKYPDIAKSQLAADGKMYVTPNEGFGETNRTIWMYREDILKKNGLTAPNNYEELYETAKKLKQLYPDSYPFVFRVSNSSKLQILKYMSANFDTYDDYFYDNKTKQVRYGPTEDNYKKMIEYMVKFAKEGLMPPDWLTTETKQWQDLISTNRGFFTADYIGRVDFFNTIMRKENPQFNFAFMPPPAGFAGAKQQNAYTQFVEGGMSIAANSTNIKGVAKYLDFYYSEEGREVSSWGKEGETFVVENGKKKMKSDFVDVTDLRKKTGLASFGTYTWIDFDAHLSLSSPEQQAVFKEAKKYDSELKFKPPFTDKELEIVSTVGKALEKDRDETIIKMILGDISMADWDKYVANQKKLGLQQMLDIYKTAYERLNNTSLK